MKRYAKIITACLMIVALTVDSVTACWFFARRVRCRPCPPRCYSGPVVYSSCGIPAGPARSHAEWQSYPPGRNGMMPQAPLRGDPPMPPAPGGADRARPAPADRDLEPSPSDRGDSAPLEPDRGTSPRDTDPMPPTDSTEPAPSPFENPFSQPRGDEPPAAAEDTAPALDNRAPPAPGVTEPDNPFAPRPGATETTPPAETTPAPDADNPFAPRDSAPPAPADENNPFAPRTGAADAPEATESSRTTPPVEDLFAPRTTDTQPPADNPFAPRPADTGSTADDPFRLPVDTAKPPMSAVNEAPMNDAPATPMNDANDGTSDPAPATESMPQPALDNPFAPPAPDRVSTTNRAPELADAMRVWTDITGKHQVRGQMKRILVAERKVRILKETGKYTTVPFAKLSVADRTFVARHAIEPSTLLAETR